MKTDEKPGQSGAAPAAGGRDFWLCGQAVDLPEAFAGIGRELVRQVCITGPAKHSSLPLELLCHAGDPASLLLSWIETLLYVLDARQVALSDFKVSIDPAMHLKARCITRPLLSGRLQMPCGLDASTARVFKTQEGFWIAETKLLLPPSRLGH